MLVGLIGSNIAGSLSPALHEDAFAAIGMTGHYHLMDTGSPCAQSLPGLLDAVRLLGFAGVNVTYPFKEAVLPLLDEVSPEAAEIGAVNTVVIDGAGRTKGHNTDRSGFRRAFEEALGADTARGNPVLLLGAGGAGRAVAFALMDLGAAPLRVYDRDATRAAGLGADLVRRFGGGSCEVLDDPVPAAAAVAGIVNATPVGMSGHPGLPMATEQVLPRHFVADVIYTPIDTRFVIAARRNGSRTMNGGGMCVHQAADAFRHFTGRAPDVDRMKHVFAEACARRDAMLSTG